MRSSILIIFVIITVGMVSFKNHTELLVTSSAFLNNSIIPSKYSCEGEETNPPLHITGIPAATLCLAIIVHDPDAPRKGGFTHWVVWNADTTLDIQERYNGGEQGYNGAMKNGYKGMCPPSGTHHYHFMVSALDKRLTLDKTTDKAGLEKAMQGHVLAMGKLTGLYKKVK